ncbi:hypothetical protein CU097_012006, partial [Rhizopus azygosporus]
IMKGIKLQRDLFDPSKPQKPLEWKRTGWKRPSDEAQSSQAVIAESSQAAQKRARTTNERGNELMETLQQQFENTLTLRIEKYIDKDGNLQQLKETCLIETRLPRGTVTGAERQVGAKATELERILKKRKTKNS